uniref:activating transcription factor 7-interacting protein 1 isoform X3 n=1 Tax=Jaculus jaculus TaxID=51337 RepID=UPI001E1B1621|nr:activating transcription factor 7-interacting protein 1 isoform X3 [Jaculus jaculus]
MHQDQRFDMDSIEEPQKRVFKARKTMRVSDRQQLETVYKVREELLKTDGKLLNGNHENGDLDPASPLENADSVQDRDEVNGIEAICFESEESKTEWKEAPCFLNANIKNEQDDDLSCEPLSANNVTPDPASNLTTEPAPGEIASSDLMAAELVSGDPVSGDPHADSSLANLSSADPTSSDPSSGDIAFQESTSENLSPGNFTSDEVVPGDSVSTEPVSDEPISGAVTACELSSSPAASVDCASDNLASDPPPSEEQPCGDQPSGDPACSRLTSEDLVSDDVASDELVSGASNPGESTLESPSDSAFKASSVPVGGPDPETDKTEHSSNKNDEFFEKHGDDEKLDQTESKASSDEEKKADSNTDDNKDAVETASAMICSDLPPENEKKVEDDPDTELAVGEETISSSMEIDQSEKNEDENSAELVETVSENVTKDDKNEDILENTDSMETDEIIPILEKLAPAEDELTCFSKTLLPIDETNQDLEEKMEGSFGSLSKQESSESLPKEAFLVLSDEEDISCEKDESEDPSQNQTCSPAEVEKNEKDSKPDEEEQEVSEENERPEKNDFSRRKRSKSEDMDNVQSKRRRYIEEEYEAEFQVKITAKGDVNQKLQKVIQWLLEEKLCALQYAVFDKTLADLKTRVEKIECHRRHKTVLTELQAKIARLTKRFGAAKEDLKKRQENPPNPPLSPGKPASDVNSNNMTYRNAGTVRQLLESKRNVGESVPPSFQTSVNAASSASLVTPPAIVSSQPKLQTPATSGSLTAAPLLPAPSTATVVATTQVPSGNPQPTISLQPLPVILHVPVAVTSQPQLLQSHPGTLVTNQPSGNVEFISVQSPPTVSGLTKNPVSLPSLPNHTKPNNMSAVSSPSIPRNSSTSAAPLGTTLAVQAVPTAHSIVQATRTSLPTVGPSGLYSPSSSRGPIQMKIPISAFSSPSSAEQSSTTTPRIENQANKATDVSVNKKAADSTSQSGKPTGSDSGGVIDLTMDDEETGTSHSNEPKKLNHTPVSTMSSSQPMPRPLQPIQPAPPLQPSGVPTSGPSQTTIHLLPTAPTTVNVTHRPVTQVTTRLPVTRAPANHQVVYTTLPAPPAQAPLRGTVMQAPAVRQVNPQNSVTVRVPQTTTYVVNNGLTLGSAGPQLTVHHRPPQVHTEPPRPMHPAPLPEAPQPQRLPPEAASTSLPQKPHLKLARVQSQNGIVLSWSVLEVDRSCATVDSYHLYAYHEEPSATAPSQWKKIGEVKALPLPMACTLTQFVSGSKYYFAVRAKDIYGRFGPFCDPQSTDVISSSQNS